ncbi:TetR/AcrR family transcriptional regulator [Microlunatus soli]|uniref:DNA-binding transcriptional regulator, AcrR family n=1 Tax=Microlunatus soli TaxID=630515 RepID=A0A1H2A5Y3_9ACTN|nr:TetR/AcrR family transcriptional regulator [Microlunatus soli]SDT41375.1 DNA-binding transcriptional regulator, AcrR family [Microlunatus soli]
MTPSGNVPSDRLTRPGGRTARVREDVLTAAGDQLAETGLPGLDLGVVAARAGVGKSTVYRRWGTVPGLIADLLTEMATSSLPRTDSGDLDSDLRANARLVRKTLIDPRQGTLFTALIAAATTDPATAAALHRFYAVRVQEWAPCVQSAIARGEVPVGTDPAQVIRATSAPLYYRLLTTPDRITVGDADRAARAASVAAKAGVFVN